MDILRVGKREGVGYGITDQVVAGDGVGDGECIRDCQAEGAELGDGVG
jgi:hypothetical protein